MNLKFLDNYILYYIDRILKKGNLKNGFRDVKERKTDWKHGLGFGIEKTVLFPKKNPDAYRSKGERQRRENSEETMACTNYASCNDLEIIMNRMKEMVKNGEANDVIKSLVKIFEYFELYDENGEANLSDKFQAIVSGTSRRGNNFNNNCDAFRKYGIIAEKFCPTPEKYTWDEYYAKPSQLAYDKGKEFLEYVEINHEWCYPAVDNDHLLYSPSTTSVYAGGDWNSETVHYKPAYPHNHAVVRDGMEQGKYDKIFDSYPPFNKKTSWDYGLGKGKIFTFTLKKDPRNLVYKFIEENDGKNIKHPESPAIWYLQEGKKKLYPNWLTYISFNGLKTGYLTVDRRIIEQIDDGEKMDIEKSLYWPFLKDVKQENQQQALLELLYKK